MLFGLNNLNIVTAGYARPHLYTSPPEYLWEIREELKEILIEQDPFGW